MNDPPLVDTTDASDDARDDVSPVDEPRLKRREDFDGDDSIRIVDDADDAGVADAQPDAHPSRDGTTDASPSAGGGRRYEPERSIKTYFTMAKKKSDAGDDVVTLSDDENDDDDDLETNKTGGNGKRPKRKWIDIKFEKDEREFTTRSIGGVSVKFPADIKPHPAQMMAMSSMIRALNNKENAMIESPTGTGKTLALLCGALAWQEAERRRTHSAATKLVLERKKYEVAREKYLTALKDGDGKKKDVAIETGEGWRASDERFLPADEGGVGKTPKIFICSRTHSQLEQMLRELKRTGYAPRFSVLSSRQRLCAVDKTDAECQELIGTDMSRRVKNTNCGYYNRHSFVSKDLERFPANGRTWDLEDFANIANAQEGCAFFALREMYESADVIFAPYNYLFDFNIRRAMQIDIKGAAIIIDEGHNIEDVCRTGATAEIKLDALKDAVEALKRYEQYDQKSSGFKMLRAYLAFYRAAHDFLDRALLNNMRREFTIPSGGVRDFIDDMFEDCIGPQDITDMEPDFARLKSEFPGDVIKHITAAMNMASILSAARNFPQAYNVIFGTNVSIDGDECFGLVVLCMQPSLAFHNVAEQARSVVLTSGTLSPMGTFELELGAPFPIKIEAPHVVPRSHIHVELSGAIGEITYKATEGDVQGKKFAENLGRYLLTYANVIPGGMLVFLPKYSLIERLLREWHVLGLFAKLSDKKYICVENRGTRGFNETLDEFKRGNDRGKGSLMLAVFRGKVSEGIDFKDDAARAVFCVGIPFPNVKDVRVKAKRDYNDAPWCKSRGMLSGGSWYRAQAYRAYNQALGRCIRHPKDYAALFLVDARFREGGSYMTENISKWIRQNVQAFDSVDQSVRCVSDFFKRLRECEKSDASSRDEKENVLKSDE